jgi:hypothetical protein
MNRVLGMLSALMLGLSFASATPARAQVPSPANSSVDACLIVCPRGDFVLHVTVRNEIGNPIPGSSVAVDLCPTPTVHLCPALTVCTLQSVTDGNGQVAFAIEAGGITTGPVNVIADGVILRQLTVASPDRNGDLVVDATDVALVSGRQGMVDRTADLDCDGSVVDAQDVAVAQAHVGHVCSGPTRTVPSSWGSVKTIYR